MNTPTPESDKAKIAFTSLFANDDAYWIPYAVGKKLERERDEARGQRDRLAGALQKVSTSWNFVEVAREALQSLTPNEKP